MENNFRNIPVTTKVCPGKFGYPFKSYDFSKFWLISCMPPSQVALCYILWCHNSTTVYRNCTQNNTKFHKIIFFINIFFPSTFILGYVRAIDCACNYDWPVWEPMICAVHTCTLKRWVFHRIPRKHRYNACSVLVLGSILIVWELRYLHES